MNSRKFKRKGSLIFISAYQAFDDIHLRTSKGYLLARIYYRLIHIQNQDIFLYWDGVPCPRKTRGRMPFAPTWAGLEPAPTRGTENRRMTSDVVDNRDGGQPGRSTYREMWSTEQCCGQPRRWSTGTVNLPLESILMICCDFGIKIVGIIDLGDGKCLFGLCHDTKPLDKSKKYKYYLIITNSHEEKNYDKGKIRYNGVS
jgi:hypothetical protein